MAIQKFNPVFTFSNNEWSDNFRFTGALGREPGEELGFYTYTLGDLSAGSNYTQVLDSEPTFAISAPVGVEIGVEESDLKMICYSNAHPTNPILEYTLPVDGRITLTVRSITGQVVKVIESNRFKSKGVYKLSLEEYGMGAGLYLLTLQLKNREIEMLRTIKLVKGY